MQREASETYPLSDTRKLLFEGTYLRLLGTYLDTRRAVEAHLSEHSFGGTIPPVAVCVKSLAFLLQYRQLYNPQYTLERLHLCTLDDELMCDMDVFECFRL